MRLPQSMQAAILVEQNKPLIIDRVELPQILEVGQVLVKVHCSGICGSQLGEIDGAKGEDRNVPHLLGHEASGVVQFTGAGVRFVESGDHVVLHWRKSRGIESVPPVYTWNGSPLNAGLITTFNEYAIVSENRLTPIAESFDLELASLYGCAVTTGFGVVENNAKIKLGESVVVFGAGGVGLNVVQAADLHSAYPIIAVDLYDERLNLAKTLGATHIINSAKKDAKPIIKEILGEQGLDIFIDNTGQPTIIEMGYELTKPQGRIVLVGVPRKGNPVSIYSLPLHFGKTINGSHGGETVPHEDIPRYQKLFDAGRVQLKPLITDYFTLNEINLAIKKMRSGEIAGRCLIKMSD